MSVRQTIAMDVSGLPAELYGPSASLWWGMICLIAIEAMGFALAIATYLYLRLQEARWPPAGWAPPSLLYGTANLVLLLISTWPMRRVDLEARAQNRRAVLVSLAIWLVLALMMLGIRALEFAHLHVKWDSNAYGSAVWLLLGLHTLHLASSFGESSVLAVYSLTHPLDRSHALDLQINAVYWYFIVGSWALLYWVLYASPWLLN
jgi:cytochrome c oxidase subunit I+III